MTRSRFIGLTAALALALPVGAVPAAADTAQDQTALVAPANLSLAAAYDVYMGGIRVARADTSAAVGDDSYQARIGLTLQGLAAAFSPDWTWIGSATGRRDGADLVVDRLDTSRRVNGETNRQSFLFHGGGNVEIRYIPERNRPNTPELPPAQLAGALDVVSAVLTLLVRQNSHDACDARMPVLDGRKLFTATAVSRGPAELARAEQGIYGGPAMRCSLTLVPAAGEFSSGVDPQTGRAREFFQAGSGSGTESRNLDVWMAPPRSGAPAVPVRIESDSPWGRVVIHLVAFDG